MVSGKPPSTSADRRQFEIVRVLTILVACFLLVPAVPAVPATVRTTCQLCEQPFVAIVYTTVDKVTEEKLAICATCALHEHNCFACGLPIIKDMTSLSDGRNFCARDAARAVISDDQILALVRETQKLLADLFRDQLVFPVGDTDIRPVDRVTIETLFAKPGNDFACPSIMGFYRTVQNQGERRHDISLLAGLTATGTRAVYAHELTHAWIADNVPGGRNLGRDAREGFCELVAYLLMEQLGDDDGMKNIARNTYTRGQFELFLRAKRNYTLGSVIEWMRYGKEPLIEGDGVDHVLRTQPPPSLVKPLWQLSAGAAQAAAEANVSQNRELRLKAVVGSASRRTALINDRSFMKGENGKVQLGDEKIEIRVLEIGEDFVRLIRVAGGNEETLRLLAK